ncbi:hypothetical protein K438DRAFT_1621889, partial [Mycena galopus ATCC 62051]
TAFVAYQYFLHVVPTTYIAPRSVPLHMNQYRCVSCFVPSVFFSFLLCAKKEERILRFCGERGLRA